MVFSSNVFLYLFLPLVILLYYLMGRQIRNLFLLLVSLVFYFWGETYLVAIMMLSIVANYVCGLAMTRDVSDRWLTPSSKGGKRTRRQRIILLIGVAINLGVLFYYKYNNFLLENVFALLATLKIEPGIQDSRLVEIALPIGISFYTFQSMSYIIDVYMGKVKATTSFINFGSYVSMFPQLIAGPIVRYEEIERELRSRVLSSERFCMGAKRFIIGLSKKVLIANTVATIADGIFALPVESLTVWHAWGGCLAYTIQIYYDFSGYSDMAIGLGHILGFTFPENFKYPYIAASIQDFWRRWHMTLSRWLRDYLYFPLGGNRLSPRRTYINLFTVFVLCGLWHGAAWTFVAWGLYHGLFLVLERLGGNRVLQRVPLALRHIYALVVIVVGWAIFRAETLDQGVHMIAALFGLGSGHSSVPGVGYFIHGKTLAAMLLGILFSFPVGKRLFETLERAMAPLTAPRLVRHHASAIADYAIHFALFWISLASLATGAYNPFLYFRF